MPVVIRPYREGDLEEMRAVWNEVVRAGNAFPQTDTLSAGDARAFFAAQSHCAVAVLRLDDGSGAPGERDGVADGCGQDSSDVVGLYILHPNNVGRCGHVANASYAVSSRARGCGIGRLLVEDSLARAAALGFRGLQFNAVVASNVGAIHLYEKLGFARVGTIPEGFRNLQGEYEDIHIFYHSCDSDGERLRDGES